MCLIYFILNSVKYSIKDTFALGIGIASFSSFFYFKLPQFKIIFLHNKWLGLVFSYHLIVVSSVWIFYIKVSSTIEIHFSMFHVFYLLHCFLLTLSLNLTDHLKKFYLYIVFHTLEKKPTFLVPVFSCHSQLFVSTAVLQEAGG